MVILLVVASSAAASDSICPQIESRGEGHWPIPEEAFTKQNAELAANRIQEIVSTPQHDDVLAVGPECALRNQSIIIEGYLLKSDLSNWEGTKYYESNQERFCNFLKKEAATCH
jgi:hypothetical protein